MTNATTKRLLDVLGACRAVRSFTAGLDFGAYERNLLVRSGVERQLEIIGEALNLASAADASLGSTLPHLRRFVAVRNRVIHGYDTVDDAIVWDVIMTRLPDLEREVIELLASTGDLPDDRPDGDTVGSRR